jgi:tetratricopeptide (TPR) repeat protein
VKSAGLDAFALAAARLSALRRLRQPRLQQIASDLRNGHIESAEKELSAHIARHPRDADALCLKAQASVRLDRSREGLSLLARCLELAPDYAAARFDYAKLLLRMHMYGEALAEADRLLTGDNRNPLFRQLKADILTAVGEEEQSLVICRQLAAENPDRAESWIKYGDALRTMGFRDECVAAYRKAIDCRPSFGLAWWRLAYLKTFRFSDADNSAMREQIKRPELTADDRINFQFSLGKAFEDLHDYGRSFEHYAIGNAARRVGVDYQIDTMTSRVAGDTAPFTPAFLRSRSDWGCKAPDPIFVVGRPRSGSTLIEQILSSHPAMEGTAELPYVWDLARRLVDCESAVHGIGYPQVLEKLEPAALAAFGDEYLRNAKLHRKLGRPFFIDKAPANYHHVGLIHLMLPNAKIIDARRHPAACCVSMFKHNYDDTNLRLRELGHVYRDYVQLMAYFDRVLPGRIHRVIYEDMVADPETEIRRLLDYLGLPFEESCLRFYESKRAVRTPSSEQVRRPISGEAVDHWRHFEPWLAPLFESLGSVLVDYPRVPEELDANTGHAARCGDQPAAGQYLSASAG